MRSTYDSHDLQDILQTRSPRIGFPAARFRETSTSRLQVLLSRPCPLNTSSHRDCAARFYAIPGLSLEMVCCSEPDLRSREGSCLLQTYARKLAGTMVSPGSSPFGSHDYRITAASPVPRRERLSKGAGRD